MNRGIGESGNRLKARKRKRKRKIRDAVEHVPTRARKRKIINRGEEVAPWRGGVRRGILGRWTECKNRSGKVEDGRFGIGSSSAFSRRGIGTATGFQQGAAAGRKEDEHEEQE